MIIHAHIKSCLFILPSPPFSKTCGPAPCGSDRIGPAFSPVISKNIMGLLCWTSSKRQMVGENTEKSVNMGPIGRLDGGWKNGIFSSISLGWVRKSVGAEFGMRVRRVTRWTFICQSPVHWNGHPSPPWPHVRACRFYWMVGGIGLSCWQGGGTGNGFRF